MQAGSSMFRCTHPDHTGQDICSKPDEHIVNMITPPNDGHVLQRAISYQSGATQRSRLCSNQKRTFERLVLTQKETVDVAVE
jgi:hypothetical protein